MATETGILLSFEIQEQETKENGRSDWKIITTRIFRIYLCGQKG